MREARVPVRSLDPANVTLRPDRGRAGDIRGYTLTVREAGQETVRHLDVADTESMLWLQLRRPALVARGCVTPESSGCADGSRRPVDLWRYREAWYAASSDATLSG